VLLAANAVGDKLKPLVIGNAQKPRCFKNINVKDLPVIWKANKKAWMVSSIFEEWLQKLNRKFKSEDRKILLFVDNCPSHPTITLSNIKLQFLPPNTTSLIQPLDQGVIRAFKENYRKLILRRIINEFEKKKTFNLKDINVLDAIYWVAKAWDEVKSSTISKCFKNSGFDLDLVEEDKEEDNVLSKLVEKAKDFK